MKEGGLDREGQVIGQYTYDVIYNYIPTNS